MKRAKTRERREPTLMEWWGYVPKLPRRGWKDLNEQRIAEFLSAMLASKSDEIVMIASASINNALRGRFGTES